jgi:hypothetical protein
MNDLPVPQAVAQQRKVQKRAVFPLHLFFGKEYIWGCLPVKVAGNGSGAGESMPYALLQIKFELAGFFCRHFARFFIIPC